jgi:nicotinate-nucleotide adenylyltransferase
MGSDSVRDIPTWHDPAGFLAGCDGLCVMQRPGVLPEQLNWVNDLSGLPAKVVYMPAPILEVSSSEIRRLVSTSGPYRYLVPEGVYHIIRDRNLYLPG